MKYITKFCLTLNDWFQRKLNFFPENPLREKLRFKVNKIHYFSRNQSLSDLLYCFLCRGKKNAVK